MKKRMKVNSTILLSLLVLITSLCLGLTVAWFTSSSNVSGTIIMGHLKVTDITDSSGATVSWNKNNIVPGESIASGNYTAKIDTNIAYYTRLLFKASVTPLPEAVHNEGCPENKDNDILSISIGNGTDGFTKSSSVTKDGYTAYYKLTPSTKNSTAETFSLHISVDETVGNGGCKYYMGASISLEMIAQVIQAEHVPELPANGQFANADEMQNWWNYYYDNFAKDETAYPSLSFSYSNSPNVATVIQVMGGSNISVTIPDKVLKNGTEYAVTTIGANSFQDSNNITNVTLLDGIVSIKENAFANCTSLKYTEYGNAKYLGNSGNPYLALIKAKAKNIDNVTIHTDCKIIAGEAFKNCSALDNVTIPNNTISIDANAFAGCTNLNNVDFENTVGWYKTADFEYGSNITPSTLVTQLKNGVSLYRDAFALTFTLMENSAVLSKCNLNMETAEIPSVAKIDGTLYPVTIIGRNCFDGFKGKTILLPDSIDTIGAYAFQNCINLETIDVTENTISYIANTTKMASSIANISLSDKTIFAYSSGKVAEHIAKMAQKLKNFSAFLQNLPNEADGSYYIPGYFDARMAFKSETSAIRSITLPSNMKGVYVSHNYRKLGSDNVIPNKSTDSSINSNVLSGTSVTIADVIARQKRELEKLRQEKTNCQAVAFPSTLTSLNFKNKNGLCLGNADLNMTSTTVGQLTNAYLTKSANDLTGEDCAIAFKQGFGFIRCESNDEYPTMQFNYDEVSKTAIVRANGNNKPTGSVNIPSQVTKNGINYIVNAVVAFNDCSSLTNITIPTSIMCISDNAFDNCPQLNYSIDGNAKYLGNADNAYMVLVSAINTNIDSVTINENCVMILGKAFANCAAPLNLTIPTNIKFLGSEIMAGCVNVGVHCSSKPWKTYIASDEVEITMFLLGGKLTGGSVSIADAIEKQRYAMDKMMGITVYPFYLDATN